MKKAKSPLDVVDASAKTVREIESYFKHVKNCAVTEDADENRKNEQLYNCICAEVVKITKAGFKSLI